MPRPAPPAAAILCRSKRQPGDGGHFRALYLAATAATAAPLTFTENSAAATAAASSGSGRRGRGREGRGTENKKGGGKGEEGVGNGSKLSVQRSRCCSHHPILAATSIELRLAASAKACQKPNLSLWGSRTHQSRPEWIPHHPISSLAAPRHQSAQGGGEEPQGQARLRRSPAAVRKAVFAKALRPSWWRKGN